MGCESKGIKHRIAHALGIANPCVCISLSEISKISAESLKTKGGIGMTNANKVTLPREVAEAIEFLRKKIGVTNFGLIAGIAEGERGYDEWATVEQYASNKQDELLAALVNGYEVEKSPEEEVRDYYGRIKDVSNGDDIYDAQAYAIETTLELLGIRIEGVNAE